MSPKIFVLGFINLGASTKRQIANFQFVAPLMAFFNPSLNDTSTVHYFGDGECLSIHISLIVVVAVKTKYIDTLIKLLLYFL